MNSPYRLGIYEKALKPQPLPRMFADAAQAGYDNFEISLDETDRRLERLDWTHEQVREVRNAAEDAGIQIFSACFSGHRKYALGSADTAVERCAMDLMRKGINFCCRLGVRVLQITGSDVYYEPSTPDTQQRYCDNLAMGTDMAESAGVMLAIEPVDKYITSVGKAMEIVRAIDSPWLRVYPDAANLVVQGYDPVRELALAQGHIVGLHLRDANPQTSYNLPWGTGTLDFIALFQFLDRIQFNAPILFEQWREDDPDYLENAIASRQYLIQKIHEARELAALAITGE